MELYYDYERDFVATSKSVTTLITRLSSIPANQKKGAERDINALLRDLEAILEKMNEAASESGQKGMLEPSLRRRGQEIQRLRRDLGRKLQDDSPLSTEEELEKRRANQREDLIDGLARIEKGTERLQNTVSIALENEEIAADTLGTLYQQRTTLENSAHKVTEINQQMNVANENVKAIGRRSFQDKIILGVVNSLLFLFICVLVYLLIAD
jgi:chromosome segregation ATPase